MGIGVEFYSPVKVLAGEWAMDNIATELAFLDSRKPLVIARSGEHNGWAVRALIDAFGETDISIGVFAGVGNNPTIDVIKDIHNIYTTRGFDALIAVGGKEVLHTAKITNVAVSLAPTTLRSLLTLPQEVALPNKRLKPLVAIPNLVSDGYEFSKYALFADKRYESPSFIPNMMVLDKYAIEGVFTQAAARSSAIAMLHALDSYTCERRSPFSDAYAASLLSMLISGVALANNSRSSSWKLPLANGLALAGCLLSNTDGGGRGYGLAFALSRATDTAIEECAAALLMALAKQAIAEQGDEIGEVLMPLLDVNSPQAVIEDLLAACAKIIAIANVDWERMIVSRDEQTVIAERVSGGAKDEECLEILQSLSGQREQRRAGR